jgi:uncharacterized protein YejL (UPF0352 family)
MFECEKCNKQFMFDSLLKKHQSRKRSCVTVDDYNIKIKNITETISNKINESLITNTHCMFCEKQFSNKSNLSKHINKVCSSKLELDKEKNKIIEDKNKMIEDKKNKERDNEIKQLRTDMLKLLEKQSQTIQTIQPQNITNNITNNTINQTNNVIMINSFGKEDLSHITLQDYKQYLNTYFKGFINFIEKVHFDDTMPANHNICITNLKSKDIKVYEGDKWVAKPKTDIIDKFLRKKLNTLIDKCEELEESDQINEKLVDKFSEFQINYMDNSAKKNTKDDVILMIYNNKDKIKVK